MWSFQTSISEWATKWKFPSAVSQWLSTTRTYKVMSLYWQSDLTASNIMALSKKLEANHFTAVHELYNDYQKFLQLPETIHRDVVLSEEEKLAYDLSERKNELTEFELNKLQQLLINLDRAEQNKHQKTLKAANDIVLMILSEQTLSKDINQKKLDHKLNAIKQNYKFDPDIDGDEVFFLARSRIYILTSDKVGNSQKIISFVVPVYKEFIRLKPKSEAFKGEDFLKIKCQQLQFLFQGCKQLEWKLYFVDDASPNDKTRTIDMIKEKIADSFFDEIRTKIICLGFENFVEQIKCYKDPQLNQLSPEDFAEKSIKGGVMQCALRYLAGISFNSRQKFESENDVIVLTDADMSTNLGLTGRIIWENLCNGAELAIGSRRLPGSVVVGKSSDRHLLSFAFNFLAHVLLNVEVSDTQVGCKAISPSAVTAIHENFNDLTMTFDVEMIRGLQDKALKITSVQTYWRDSPFESKSTGQSKNMFAGLINIFKRMYSLESTESMQIKPMENREAFLELAAKLQNEKEFYALMRLADNQKFHFLVAFSSEIYSILTPKVWRNFVNHLKLFLCELANGEIEQHTLNNLFKDLQKLYDDSSNTPAIEFIFHEFPEIFSVAELLYRNRDYTQIIAPLLFGERIVGRIFSKLHYRDLIEWKQKSAIKNKIDVTAHELFMSWCKEGQRQESLPRTQPEPDVSNPERQEKGWQRLNKLDAQLKKEKIITIVMQYDQDETKPEYVDAVIRKKMQILAKQSENLNNIRIEFLVVDARLEKKSNVNFYIDNILKEETTPYLTGRQISLDTKKYGTGKAVAIRFGLNTACQNADVISYIDFSNKIPILDIGNLFADVIETQMQNQHIASIGSRRLPESEVQNKPLTFLLRSLGLNLAVKSLFPNLFYLSDTQTGFKCFSSVAWKAIQQQLECQSLAFDVEILIALNKAHYNIKEQPVTFNDNNLDNTELADPASEMLSDLLRIRARFQKPVEVASLDHPIRIGAGAEHTVYDVGDGSLLKIPTQFADPDFMILLKNLIFNQTQDMVFDDRETALFISQFNQVLNSKYLRSYISLMRNVTDINVFVMRMISAFENKTKSFDLRKVLQLGDGLIGPFEFCQPFSIMINNKTYTFDERHQVKRCKRAEKIFKDEFFDLLQIQYNDLLTKEQLEVLENKINDLLDQAINLFERMWKRGLFDLDTNILADLGYFKVDDQLQLMCLDPGEVTDDLALINVDTAINLLPKRSDVLLLRAHLAAFPKINADKIVNYYLARMKNFLEQIRFDLQKEKNLRDFGSDQRNHSDKDFSIYCSFKASLPKPYETKSNYTEEEISVFLSAGYQLPYTKKPLAMIHTDFKFTQRTSVHILVNQVENYNQPPNTEVAAIERGNILPMCDHIKKENLLKKSGNIAILLDAGAGTRSSLLGIQAGSKGQIKLAGYTLSQHTSESLQNISEYLATHGLSDYVLIGSCDDLLSQDKEFNEQLANYFHLDSKPGLFWCELPESGKKHMPLTEDDTITFLNDHFTQDKIDYLFKNIPFTEGYAKADLVKKTKDGLMHLYQHYQTWQQSEKSLAPNSTNHSTMINIPGMSACIERYMKLLQWYGMTSEVGGLKKPFLMVMSKLFLNDFIHDVVPLIPEYAKMHITWEKILLRGMRADEMLWHMLGKPPNVTSHQWNKIYYAIQKLKNKHHIDTDHPGQNKLRGIPPIWQSLDDPYALLSTVKRTFTDPHHHISEKNCTLISDKPFSKDNSPAKLSAKQHITIIALDSDLHGEIHPTYPSGIVASLKTDENILLSGIKLGTQQKLYPIPGHVVVEIDGLIYSTSLKPTTKDNLKKQAVYCYDPKTGKPGFNPETEQFDNKPFKNLAKFQLQTKKYTNQFRHKR